MIRYTLQCAEGHRSESWFKSAATFDALKGSGQLTCAICGSAAVEKALMTPRLGGADTETPAPVPVARGTAAGPPGPSPEALKAALQTLRAHVEATSDYVGAAFATEARAIHEGTAPERPIYGQASPLEAKALVEDGIPVAPLPFIPRKQTN